MQNDHPPLDPNINPALALKINQARGDVELLTMMVEQRKADADEYLAVALLELRDREDGK